MSDLFGPIPNLDSAAINAVLRQMRLAGQIRNLFISYHHKGDQRYYDKFSATFADAYGVFRDNSLGREIGSDDADYVMRRIREDYITGTSCTIVLCGQETPWRKYVDWEIKATLDKEHGLIGINLPTNPHDALGKVRVPDRFFDNYHSGYAVWLQWADLFGPGIIAGNILRQTVETAILRAASKIVNNRQLMSRNGTSPYQAAAMQAAYIARQK